MTFLLLFAVASLQMSVPGRLLGHPQLHGVLLSFLGVRDVEQSIELFPEPTKQFIIDYITEYVRRGSARRFNLPLLVDMSKLLFKYKLEQAEDFQRRVVDVMSDPTFTVDPHSWVRLGNCMLRLETNEPIVSLYIGLVRYTSADIYTCAGCYRRALSLDEDCVEAHYHTGLLKGSARAFYEVMESDPTYGEAWIDFALAHRELLVSLPDDKAFHTTPSLYKGDGRSFTSAEFLAQGLIHCPNHSDAWNLLGSVLKPDSAIDVDGVRYSRAQCFAKAIETSFASLPTTWLSLGEELLRIDQEAGSHGVSRVSVFRHLVTPPYCFAQAALLSPQEGCPAVHAPGALLEYCGAMEWFPCNGKQVRWRADGELEIQ